MGGTRPGLDRVILDSVLEPGVECGQGTLAPLLQPVDSTASWRETASLIHPAAVAGRRLVCGRHSIHSSGGTRDQGGSTNDLPSVKLNSGLPKCGVR